MKKWTIDDSRELYNINGWGTSYFGVNDKGDMYVTPCKDNVQIDLRDVMDELQLRDVTPPVLLRFPDILDNRIENVTGKDLIGKPTAIESVGSADNAVEVARYNAAGQRINGKQKGLNIVKLSNGTTLKVVVK